MTKINNCLNCKYNIDIKNNSVLCDRPKSEGRIAEVKNIVKVCCCHSKIDSMKKDGLYVDDGLYIPDVDTELLLEQELIRIIWGQGM